MIDVVNNNNSPALDRSKNKQTNKHSLGVQPQPDVSNSAMSKLTSSLFQETRSTSN